MKTWARILTVLLGGLVLVAQLPGAAPTVPSATYTNNVNTGPTQHSPGTITGTRSGASGQSTVGAAPSPYIDISVASSPGAGIGASGSIVYYFEYFGTDGTLPIDLQYNASFSA